ITDFFMGREVDPRCRTSESPFTPQSERGLFYGDPAVAAFIETVMPSWRGRFPEYDRQRLH
ncbi:MAG: hypothetical protein ACLFO1_03945, partial [Spirochaetaceae bacterium]